jgi:hypothetical protein
MVDCVLGVDRKCVTTTPATAATDSTMDENSSGFESSEFVDWMHVRFKFLCHGPSIFADKR